MISLSSDPGVDNLSVACVASSIRSLTKRVTASSRGASMAYGSSRGVIRLCKVRQRRECSIEVEITERMNA